MPMLLTVWTVVRLCRDTPGSLAEALLQGHVDLGDIMLGATRAFGLTATIFVVVAGDRRNMLTNDDNGS